MASVERLIATSIDHLICVSGALVLNGGFNVRVRGSLAASLGPGLVNLRRLERSLIEGTRQQQLHGIGRPPAPRSRCIGVQGDHRSGDRPRESAPRRAVLHPWPRIAPLRPGPTLAGAAAQPAGRDRAEAQLDPATGLYTRAALHSAVQRWAARLGQETEHCLVPADRPPAGTQRGRGFETGDRLIASVAGLLSAQRRRASPWLRASPGTSSQSCCRATARPRRRRARMLQQAAAEVSCLPTEAGIPVSVSCGIAASPAANSLTR